MQPLNFTQISSKKHKAVRVWFLMTFLLVGSLLGICLALSMRQWNRYKNAQPLAKPLTKLLPKNTRIVHQNNVTQVLKTVNTKLTTSANLESLTLTDTTIEFKIVGNNPHIIADIAKELKTSDNRIQLVGLENSSKNRIIGVFTYSGAI